MRLDTVIAYLLIENFGEGIINYDYSFIVCLDCYDKNTEIYTEEPIFLNSEWDYFPSCEWCNEKIEEGINLI